ncbi:MAG: hypothetical protein ABIK21_08570 [bacterium]|nr:hypothetical protein [Patescibacteria group bacterium]
MRGKIYVINEKRVIFRILMIFVVGVVSIGYTKDVRGVSESILPRIDGYSRKPLTENEAEQVREMWRVISGQEIVSWNGKRWLGLVTVDKEKAISEARGAWLAAGYENIESVDYFIEDMNLHYVSQLEKNPQKPKDEKVGLALCLSAFFSGMKK